METQPDQDDESIDKKLTKLIDEVVKLLKDKQLSRFESFLVLDAARVVILDDCIKDIITNNFLQSLTEVANKLESEKPKSGDMYK